MAMAWTSALAIRIPEIDRQHQELFLRAGKLLEGILRGNRVEVARLIDFLGDYAVNHFAAEERWMVASGYPDYAAHKAEHDQFLREYLRHAIDLEDKGPTALVGMRVHNWLEEWLERHVARSDLSLGRFLAYGISPQAHVP